MPDTIARYIGAIDNAGEYADSLLDGLYPTALEDIDDLFTGLDNRDEELWDELEIDPRITLEEYDESDDRDLLWVGGLAGISAASTVQFFLDNREDTIIKPAAYQEQALAGFTLTRAQLQVAAKRIPTPITPKRFAKIQAQYLDDFSFLRELSNKDIYETLREFNALRPIDQQIADSMGYVSRMTSHRPGSVQFKEEVAKLIDSNSKRGLKGMNRRSVEQIGLQKQLDGSSGQLFIWVGEGGKVCDYCRPRYGEVRTIGQWDELGHPGAEVCKGGDYCRCTLQAYGELAA